MQEQKPYTGRKGYEVLSTEKFGLQRKIVANMTVESWDNIPHAAGILEPDVTEFFAEFKRLRQQPEWKGISMNTVLLYVLTQGLMACPAMNAYITFKRGTVSGLIEQFADVNVSMPMILPDGKGMMTVNIHNCESKSLRQLQDYINDVRRRMANTNLDDALFEVSIADTMQKLKKLKLKKVLGRLLGTKIGNGPINKLKGEAKKAYKALPPSEKLTKSDIEQGTIVISNVGSVYRGNTFMSPTMLEVIPPQVTALAISNAFEKPGVVTHADGSKTIEPRLYLPLGLAIDHRALDFGDTMPFILKLDEIFGNPQLLKTWL